MIQEFLASWELFQWAYLEGWLIAFLLSLIGVAVVARDQIFIGAAVSQASTVGIALTLYVAQQAGYAWLDGDVAQSMMAVIFSIVAALLTSRAGHARTESYEAITGWVFLVSAGSTVLLLAHSPLEVHRLHSSSIIGATPADACVFLVLCVLTVALIGRLRGELLLFVTDPSTAAAVGMRVGIWSAATAIWLGLAVGLSIQSSGMLYTFGMLVLPALIAKNVCREVQPMFIVSPLIAVVTAALGFVLANHHDFPPAQMTVVLLGLLLVYVWGYRGVRRFIKSRGSG